MAAGPLPAGIVQEPLSDVLPDCVAAVEADRVDGLDFHGPVAAPAGHAQHVPGDHRKPACAHPDAVGAGAGILQDRIPVFGGQRSVRSRHGGRGLPRGFGGQPFHLFRGRHAPARGSVVHFRKWNIARTKVESAEVETGAEARLVERGRDGDAASTGRQASVRKRGSRSGTVRRPRRHRPPPPALARFPCKGGRSFRIPRRAAVDAGRGVPAGAPASAGRSGF